MKKGAIPKIIAFIVLFLVTLFVFFPINNLRGYIFDNVFKETGILLVSDSMYFSLLGMPGVGMKNVNVTLPVGDQEIDLLSEHVTLKLALSGFFPPLPGISINISDLKKGGDIYSKVGKGGSSIAFYLDAEKVNLEQIGARNGNPPLKGLLNIQSDLLLNERDMSKSSGFFEVNITDLKINQQNVTPPDPAMAAFSFIIPGMKIGKLTGNLQMKNGLLEITQFKFGDDPAADFKGTVNGDIKFEKNFEQSALNIALRLKLSQKILDSAEAKTFVSFLSSYQTTPGEYGLKWNATIQDFTNFSIKAIPEKLNN
jgi:type II secretion system protein N